MFGVVLGNFDGAFTELILVDIWFMIVLNLVGICVWVLLVSVVRLLWIVVAVVSELMFWC